MKLLLTVGAQMPFDRLVRSVDAWARGRAEHSVLAQVGTAEYAPTHLEAREFLPPAEFDRAYDAADAIVGHAGIGTLFAAMQRGKPILVLPREARRRETRNDHQIATARRFERYPGVLVAWTEADVSARMDELLALEGAPSLADEASGPLIDAMARFIERA